jgi:hypothetical protein
MTLYDDLGRPVDTMRNELKVLVRSTEDREALDLFFTLLNKQGRGLIRVNTASTDLESVVYEVWTKTREDFYEIRAGVMTWGKQHTRQRDVVVKPE